MYLSSKVLGTSTIGKLKERIDAIVLTIGSDRFRRADLASIGCFNFIAAQHLSAAILAIGGIQSTRDLFERVPPSAFVLPGIGPLSIAVLGAALERKGVGGRQPLEVWMAKHRASAASELVTFDTLKASERKREAAEQSASQQRRNRQHARRDKAQHVRVERFIARNQKGSNRHAATH